MKEVSADYIEKVIDIMRNNELTEVAIEDGDRALVIKSNDFKPVIKEKDVPVQEVEAISTEESVIAESEEKKNIVPLVSNMIGIFYSKPSPTENPFVNIGDTIKEGQVVCIIETIKLMNKIVSNVSGKVVEICIEDGRPVEYGQTIMYIEKSE